MRLGQLARKLSMRPQEIVDFLSNQQISIESGSNTRIDDAHVVMVMQAFAPDLVAEVKQELAQETTEPEMEVDQPEVTESDIILAEEPNAETIEAPAAESLPEPSFIEVIKAPKIELPGLKVVGKIELPEPKKKENSEQVEEGDSGEGATLKPESRNRAFRNDRAERQERPRKNPITVQREREAREAERKRREEARLEKEKRKMIYEGKLKDKVPMKGNKPKKVSRIQERNIASLGLQQPPKTWWGKFTRWLFRK